LVQPPLAEKIAQQRRAIVGQHAALHLRLVVELRLLKQD
jgi:hypothetical protein